MEGVGFNNQNKIATSNPIESTFDRIDSPQYLNFDSLIPEARDSYFESKCGDQPADQSIKDFQKLPTDFCDDLRGCEESSKNQNHKSATIEQKNNEQCESLSSDFGSDLIRAVQTLQVNQASEKTEKIATSTPFRVKGVDPMPWRPPAKTEVRHCTRTKPFSFEERNKQILQRKARRIETVLQAEKDARKFRANPVPKFLKKSSTNNSAQKLSKSTDKQLQSSAPPQFKAKSPKVLRLPAFQPVLPHQPLCSPKPFVLNSELRAKERKLFDNCLKEKERVEEQLKRLREAAEKRREEEEMVKLRKQLVIKAQPIRRFKCVTSSVSKRPLTEPMTPTVVKRQRC